MNDNVFGGLLLLAVVSWSIVMVYIGSTLDIPAIDVYRGLTTLEITYRDSIPVDSVVVYK